MSIIIGGLKCSAIDTEAYKTAVCNNVRSSICLESVSVDRQQFQNPRLICRKVLRLLAHKDKVNLVYLGMRIGEDR